MQKLLCTMVAAGAASLSSGFDPVPEPTAERPWTLMIYGAADNDAEGPILEFLDRVRGALDDDPGMELVLFLDRSQGYSDDGDSLGADFTGARVYRLGRESAELLDASGHFPGMVPGEEHELDSADARNVGRFVTFCKERFPAERYGLLIYGHANGIAMCPDDESGTWMSIPTLSDRVGAEASVDFLALELCNMGGMEIAYQWRPGNGGFSADVLLAIPNAGVPLDWDRAFARIRSKGHATSAPGGAVDPATMTADDFGRLVIEEGHAGRRAWVEKAKLRYDLTDPQVLEEVRDHVREAAGCYDLGGAEAAKKAIDRLAVALADAEGRRLLEALRGAGEGDRMMSYAPGGKFDARPYVDLYELLDLVVRSPEASDDVRSAAEAARQAVDELVLASFGLEEGFEDFEPGSHGIFIVLPDAEAWSELSWYTPLAVDHPAGGRWSFLADGATAGNGRVENWFELLDSWYDDRSAAPEGRNGYSW